jgi:uncharacterized membrane protein SpoIIM required for sporulation
MKVVELLERRRKNWQELERYCERISLSKLNSSEISRFSALYRAACADLALSNSYQLPENTVQYLHKLVGRAHNQLYRVRRFNFSAWAKVLLEEVPQRIFNDRCVQFMFILFWGFFILSAWLSYSKALWPDFAEELLGAEMIEQMEQMHNKPLDGRTGDIDLIMASYYIQHNTGIGLQCFVWGLLVVPGLYVTIKNSLVLGAVFGYMARPDVEQREYFFQFVRAHGPFELTAIVLSAGAGLRLGLAWIMPGQYSRGASLQKTGAEMMPVMCAAMLMFFFAALIEGFLSPSGAPLWVKSAVCLLSSALLCFYFVVLGFPRRLLNAAR